VASRRRRAISPSHALGSGKRGSEKSGAHWNQVGIRPRGSLRETQGDVVIGRVREVLPRAQISLCGPHARMPGPTPLPIPRCPPHESCGRRPRGACSWKGVCARFYEARPKACRDFPHVAVGIHSLGGRPSSLARWVLPCPIVYNAVAAFKHFTGYHPYRAHGPMT
jgi:hypothetical protein